MHLIPDKKTMSDDGLMYYRKFEIKNLNNSHKVIYVFGDERIRQDPESYGGIEYKTKQEVIDKMAEYNKTHPILIVK